MGPLFLLVEQLVLASLGLFSMFEQPFLPSSLPRTREFIPGCILAHAGRLDVPAGASLQILPVSTGSKDNRRIPRGNWT